MATSPDDKLRGLLEEFGVAMLVTRTAEGQLRARPMALAEVQPDGTLWLATDRHAAKVDELAHDSHVAVTMQSETKFVSLSGTASLVEDQGRAARLWRADWKSWFPGGKEDPNLVLLRVDCGVGEYWGGSGAGGLRYVIEAGKAILTGSRPNVADDPKVHAKVNL